MQKFYHGIVAAMAAITTAVSVPAPPKLKEPPPTLDTRVVSSVDHLPALLAIKADPPQLTVATGGYESPPNQTQFSRYFTAGEFTKQGSRPLPSRATEIKCRQVALALDHVRTYYGGSITVTSGYRSAAINRRIGGAPQSQHVYGCAVDVVVRDASGSVVDNRKVYRDWVDVWLKVGGIGLYSRANGTTHFDLRENPATWDWTNVRSLLNSNSHPEHNGVEQGIYEWIRTAQDSSSQSDPK